MAHGLHSADIASEESCHDLVPQCADLLHVSGARRGLPVLARTCRRRARADRSTDPHLRPAAADGHRDCVGCDRTPACGRRCNGPRSPLSGRGPHRCRRRHRDPWPDRCAWPRDGPGDGIDACRPGRYQQQVRNSGATARVRENPGAGRVAARRRLGPERLAGDRSSRPPPTWMPHSPIGRSGWNAWMAMPAGPTARRCVHWPLRQSARQCWIPGKSTAAR